MNKTISKIEWLTEKHITVADYQIPCASDLKDGYNQGSGVKRSSIQKLMLKRILWPLFKWHNDMLVDGFIEHEVGRLINRFISNDSVFLEIGCGDMSLRRFLPSHLWYNALDLELSSFHILRVLGEKKKKVNLVLASASQIPAQPNTASLIVSTQTFEHIPEIDKTMQSIYRIAKPDATLICSISNGYCYKYVKKGPNIGQINKWTYDGFIEYMKSHHFELIEGFMKGKWIPFPLWFTKTSYQLPLSSKLEYYNTNFFYVFKVNKYS